MKDVLIRADRDDVTHKIRDSTNDDWVECYWSVSGKPHRTGRGQRALFADGEDVWGLAHITRVETGRIWFLPIFDLRSHGLTIEIDEEPPTRGFAYVEPAGEER